jgi:hypothetical protein
MTVNDKWECDFALYVQDRFVTLGTLQEIHEYTGISLKALKQYSRESYQKRFPNKRALVRLDEE